MLTHQDEDTNGELETQDIQGGCNIYQIVHGSECIMAVGQHKGMYMYNDAYHTRYMQS